MPSLRTLAGDSTGSRFNTPVGNMASNASANDVDRPSNSQLDDSEIQGKRTKKMQMVSAELKRMRYF
jgi:hypothetical protein